MQLERKGVPVVVLGTDAFVPLAREAAAAHGVPQLGVATVAHPLGGLPPAVVAAKAEGIVDRVVA